MKPVKKKQWSKQQRQKFLDEKGSLAYHANQNPDKYGKYIEEWDDERNKKDFDLTPEDVTCTDPRKVFWICSQCGNKWFAQIYKRIIMKRGCRICSTKESVKIRGKKLLEEQGSLAFHAAENPGQYGHLLKEWDDERNKKEFGLTPDDVILGSHTKVWWNCVINIEHEDWLASVGTRTGGKNRSGHGCFKCGVKKRAQTIKKTLFDKGGSLADFVAKNPEKYGRLLKEWDYDKNKKTPNDVSPHGGDVVWWKCSQGHKWDQAVYLRTSNRGRCSYCFGRSVDFNDSIVITHPDIAKEWHPTRNKPLTPDQVDKSNHKKVWWKCSKNPNHEWQNNIIYRTRDDVPCPYCSFRIVCSDNNLTVTHLDIVKDWHPTKNRPLTPDQVTCRFSNKVDWKCHICDWEWNAPINRRTGGTGEKTKGCSKCGIKKSVKIRGKKLLEEQGSLAFHAAENPGQYGHLLKEWDYERNKKEFGLTPDDVILGSNIPVWWICVYTLDRHVKHPPWPTPVYNRTKEGTGCPKCTLQTSKPEMRLYCELKTIFVNIIWQKKLQDVFTTIDWPKKLNKAKRDILLPDYNLLIEYDGSFHHDSKTEKDTTFTVEVEKLGVQVLRVRQKPLKKISRLHVSFKSDSLNIQTVKKVLNLISRKFMSKLQDSEKQAIKNYGGKTEFQNQLGYVNLLASFPGPLPGESFADLHPELAKEWHPTLNGDLKPDKITEHLHEDFWWLCPKIQYLPFVNLIFRYQHEWQAPTSARIGGHNCHFCSGRYSSPEKSLAVQNYEKTLDWHPTKNGELTPYDVTEHSGKQVFWICRECGREHEKPVKHWVKAKYGCDNCSKIGLGRTHTRNTIEEHGGIIQTHPDIAKHLHPKNNSKWETRSENMHLNSTIHVLWRCSRNHPELVWTTSVSNEVEKYDNAKKNHDSPDEYQFECDRCKSVGVKRPHLIKDWHPKNSSPRFTQDLEKLSKNVLISKQLDEKDYNVISIQGFKELLNKKYDNDTKLTVYDVSYGDSKIVAWSCSKNREHEWFASVSDRGRLSKPGSKKRASGCPYCSKNLPSKEYNLAVIRPAVAKIWDNKKNKDCFNLTPYDVTHGSKISVYWICDKGHNGYAKINSRTSGHGCNECRYEKMVNTKRKSELEEKGSLAYHANQNPDKYGKYIEEWDYERNIGLTPEDVTLTDTRKVFWICSKCQYKWPAQIYRRINGNNCPDKCKIEKRVKSFKRNRLAKQMAESQKSIKDFK